MRWPTRCARWWSTAASPLARGVPSERALRRVLGVSRGSVSRAYDRLREDGFLVSARGAGQLADAACGVGAAAPPPTRRRRPSRRRST